MRLLALLALLAPATLQSQAPPALPAVPGPSFEQVVGLRAAGIPAISPDGRHVVFPVRTVDWGANRFDNELWLSRDGAAPIPLTRTEKNSSGVARWSPDGTVIAFVADRGSKAQVHLIRIDGGEAQPITAHAEGVTNFQWAPDGKRIAFTAQEPEPPAAKARRERFGEYAVEDAEFRRSHLWIVDVVPDPWPSPAEAPCPASGSASGSASGAARDTTRRDSAAAPSAPDSARAAAVSAAQAARGGCVEPPKARRLTEGTRWSVTSFEWSPDGRRIAFAHVRDPLITSGSTSDISVVDVASRAVRALVETPGADGGPVWSPDSRWIAYGSSAGDTISDFYANAQLFKVAADGGAPVRLAADVDENVGALAWRATGLYGLVWQGASARRVVAIDPTGGRTRAVAGGPPYVAGLHFSADGRGVALLASTPESLAEVYRGTLGAQLRATPVTDMSRQVREWGLGTAELVRWQSTDGAEIEGVLHKPKGFDPARKYPLMVVIHGGPTGIDYPQPVAGYVYPVLQWLAKGAIVLRPNYRGSAGYGARFRALNVRNLGVGDAWDVLSGVDYLVRQGIVDTTRMASMGWSQGGYISAFLTTTSARFRAISVGAGISNWVTYYANTDIHPFTRQYLKATPWEDAEIYRKTSPMTFIRDARTPTLIQHGELDRRVPIANAYELFQGLQDVGVPARLVVYKGFGHGIDKPKEQLAAMWHNWQWMGRWVWGETIRIPGEDDLPADLQRAAR